MKGDRAREQVMSEASIFDKGLVILAESIETVQYNTAGATILFTKKLGGGYLSNY